MCDLYPNSHHIIFWTDELKMNLFLFVKNTGLVLLLGHQWQWEYLLGATQMPINFQKGQELLFGVGFMQTVLQNGE